MTDVEAACDPSPEGTAEATPLGLGAASATFGLLVFALPFVFSPTWTPKSAVLTVLGAVGIALVPRLVRNPSTRSAVIAAACVVAIATISTFFAANPRQAVFGQYGWGAGLIFIVTLVGTWAVGRSINDADRGLVAWLFVCGAAANAVVAVLQATIESDFFPLQLLDRRAMGLLGNPVHLGAFGAAAVGLSAFDLDRRRAMYAAGCGAFLIQMSGSRFPLAVGVVMLLAQLVRRRLGWRILAAFALGTALGIAAVQQAGTVTAGERFEGASTSIQARAESWSAAAHVVASHPLIGVGPSHYRDATSPLTTFRRASRESGDFVDAHNWVVGFATTIGLAGLAALLAWLVLGAKGAEGPYLAVPVAILACELLNPLHIALTPVAFLFLGAAPRRLAERPSRAARRWSVGLAIPATIMAVGLIWGDAILATARLDTDLDAGARSVRVLAPYGRPLEITANAAMYQFIVTGEWDDMERALEWRRRATRAFPADHWQWLFLGHAARYAGSIAHRHDRDPKRYFAMAERAFARSHVLQPWEPFAMVGLAGEQVRRGGYAEAEKVLDRLERLRPASRRAARLRVCIREVFTCRVPVRLEPTEPGFELEGTPEDL